MDEKTNLDGTIIKSVEGLSDLIDEAQNKIYEDKSKILHEIMSNSESSNINLNKSDENKKSTNEFTNNFNNYSFSSKDDLAFMIPQNYKCPKCNENFKLKLTNLHFTTIECGCMLRKNVSPEDFAKNYAIDNPFEYGCKHCKKGNNKKIVKYCTDCKEDLCEECLKEKSLYNNDTGAHTVHETHNLIDLTNIYEVKKEFEIFFEHINQEDEKSRINLVFNNLITYHSKYPSYRSYKTLKILNKFLADKNSEKPIDNFKNYKYEELRKIITVKSLEENIIYPNKIYKIIIGEYQPKEALDNLNKLENKSFDELVKLQMNILGLKDIKSLTTCSFPKLKKLILGGNRLNNDCIDVIKNMSLPNIKFISLYDNNISSPEIFGIPVKFKTLEKFYAGFNKIDIDLLEDKNKKYYFHKNLKELGLSNCFKQKTNHFITENLDIENIKYLFLNGCEFTTLKPFENIKFKNLEQFWARGEANKCNVYLTDIKEINYLQGKENIKKIVLKDNIIKNIEELVNIIPLFPNLEILDLNDNEFEDKEKEKMEKVIKQLKEKGFEKLIIKYNLKK